MLTFRQAAGGYIHIDPQEIVYVAEHDKNPVRGERTLRIRLRSVTDQILVIGEAGEALQRIVNAKTWWKNPRESASSAARATATSNSARRS